MNEKLVKAVIKQLEGSESLEDVVNHGASGGFCGFSCYSDTVDFFGKNKKLIVELAEGMANDLGEDITNMIKNFTCLKDYELTNSQVAKVLYGKFSKTISTLNNDNTVIMNALSWFALEEAARYEMDKKENNRSL